MKNIDFSQEDEVHRSPKIAYIQRCVVAIQNKYFVAHYKGRSLPKEKPTTRHTMSVAGIPRVDYEKMFVVACAVFKHSQAPRHRIPWRHKFLESKPYSYLLICKYYHRITPANKTILPANAVICQICNCSKLMSTLVMLMSTLVILNLIQDPSLHSLDAETSSAWRDTHKDWALTKYFGRLPG